ncbi:GSCOCG00004054001-RA-CDS [Cotesia congregata]|nr:GSCOCG00004054001-RA-CDS [Cotesia congregata]
MPSVNCRHLIQRSISLGDLRQEEAPSDASVAALLEKIGALCSPVDRHIRRPIVVL